MSGLYHVFFLSLSLIRTEVCMEDTKTQSKKGLRLPPASDEPACRGQPRKPFKTPQKRDVGRRFLSNGPLPPLVRPSLAPRRPRVVRNKPPPVGIPRRSRRPPPFIRWLARLSGKGEERKRLLHCFCRIDLCPPEVAPLKSSLSFCGCPLAGPVLILPPRWDGSG